MKTPFYIGITALVTISATNLRAAEAISDYDGFPGYVSGTAGYTFQPLDAITVTSLGCFDSVISWIGAPISVGLWNADGSLLGASVITESSSLFNASRYESISPVSLSLGQIYYLGAFSSSGPIVGAAVTGEPSQGTVFSPPEIQINSMAFSIGSSMAFPNSLGAPGSVFIAPNLQYQLTSVPEPSCLALVAVGSIVMMFIRRRY